MNILLIIGVVIGFGGVIFGYLHEGGILASLIQPSALAIVFGGTIGFALIGFPLSHIRRIPQGLRLMFFAKEHNYDTLVEMLCDIANKGRKDGLLSLEAEADKIGDSFIKKGLGYIADGADPEFLRRVLENEIESFYRMYEMPAKVLEAMGGAAPTMGVLGTVMGMISILRTMSSNMDSLGGKIATAFIATMYGVASANLIWLPLGGNIKAVAMSECQYREVIVEGLMAIQSGEPSSRLRDRLYTKIGEIKKGRKNKKEPEAEEE